MGNPQEQMQVVLASKTKKDLSPKVTQQFLDEMHASFIVKTNWKELLQGAPIAIYNLGLCHVAASSEGAAVILHPKPEVANKLRYESVQGNLVECANLGRYAFIKAESGMSRINMQSHIIYGKVADIVDILADPQTAKRILKPSMLEIKDAAHDCLSTAQEIESEFKKWLDYSATLHAACVDENASNDDLLDKNEADKLSEEGRRDAQKITVDETKKAQEKMGTALDEASKAFKKASDEFPSGWDIIAQDLVKGLGDALVGGLNGAMTIFTFGTNSSQGQGGGRQGGVPNDPNAPLPKPQGVQDPAYAEVAKVIPLLDSLKVIVCGKDGKIDWARAKDEEKPKTDSNGKPKTKSDGEPQASKTSIKFISNMLSFYEDSFKNQATEAQPSKLLLSILTTTSDIAKGIHEAIEKAPSMGDADPLPADSPEVKKWQTDFTNKYAAANGLLATAKNVNGNTPGGAPLMSDKNPAGKGADANSTHGQAVLEAAKNRLNTTSEAFLNSQENFNKANDRLVEQEKRLADIQAQLTKLTAQNITLKEIKKILLRAIGLIAAMKKQITGLVRFFDELATMVDLVVTHHVDSFVNKVKNLVTDNPDKDDWTVGDYTFTDYLRSAVFQGTVMIRAYFKVFADIASMWMKISGDAIMPGIDLCDELSSMGSDGQSSPDKVKAKAKALEEWSRGATDKVAKVAAEKQKAIQDSLSSTISEVEETTKLLPAPDEKVSASIKQGADAGKSVVQEGIDKQDKEDLTRFGGGLRNFDD